MDLARIRRELRERLMTGRCDGVGEILARLFALADGDDELLSEHMRWWLRFELLAHDALSATA